MIINHEKDSGINAAIEKPGKGSSFQKDGIEPGALLLLMNPGKMT